MAYAPGGGAGRGARSPGSRPRALLVHRIGRLHQNGGARRAIVAHRARGL